jgi:hypothetical protein
MLWLCTTLAAALIVALVIVVSQHLASATLSSGERNVLVPLDPPCRLVDTRAGADNVGPRDTPLGKAETYTVTARGAQGECNLPNTASGLSLNVTAVGATRDTFLTLYPDGVARPLASNLNPAAGAPPTPNAVTVDLSAAGKFAVYNHNGTVDVIVDVVGYYEDHNHDDRYFASGVDIVMQHGLNDLTANDFTTPTVSHAGGQTQVSGTGFVQTGLAGPQAIGPDEYGLRSVEYCVSGLSGTTFVDDVRVYAAGTTGVASVAFDDTDRTVSGCYTVEVGDTTGRGYSIVWYVSSPGPAVDFNGMTSTWAPVGQLSALTVDDGGGPPIEDGTDVGS